MGKDMFTAYASLAFQKVKICLYSDLFVVFIIISNVDAQYNTYLSGVSSLLVLHSIV